MSRLESETEQALPLMWRGGIPLVVNPWQRTGGFRLSIDQEACYAAQ